MKRADEANETLSFNPVDCSWEDVDKAMERAEDEVEDIEQRDRKFSTKTRRKLVRMTAILGPALEALPDELSILHGGLGVIFSVGPVWQILCLISQALTAL